MYQDILKFWFEDINPSQWWIKDEEFDKLIIKEYSEIHTRAIRCELFEWRENASGRLAEIIVLDQFSRNIFRGLPQAFANDSLALALTQEAIKSGEDKELNPVEKSFLYMPLMHSESLKIHQIATKLFQEIGIQNNIDFGIKHKKIIEQFGRYPHRNEILGRESTIEEIEFLKNPGSGF